MFISVRLSMRLKAISITKNLLPRSRFPIPLNICIILQIPWVNVVAWMCANRLAAWRSCNICRIGKWIDRRPVNRFIISRQRFDARWTRLISHIGLVKSIDNLKLKLSTESTHRESVNEYKNQRKHTKFVWITWGGFLLQTVECIFGSKSHFC